MSKRRWDALRISFGQTPVRIPTQYSQQFFHTGAPIRDFIFFIIAGPIMNQSVIFGMEDGN